MLNHIRIRNFAIIEHLDLDFSDKLTTLTGETGAGKSILLGALGLLLGDRADSDSVRAGSSKAEISAEFDIQQLPGVQQWLKEKELDADQDCLLRRRLGADGRSRAFINGSPVPLQDMRQLGEMLVDIHGQHEHQSLMKSEMQRQLLDDYADHKSLLTDVRETYRLWQERQQKLSQLQESCKDRNDRLDLLRYQVSEFEQLDLQEDEYDKLQQEHQVLANADQLNGESQSALLALYDADDNNLYALLSQQARKIEGLVDADNSLSPAFDMLTDAMVQIEETAHILRDYIDNMNADPERFEDVETRLGTIHDLSRKHHVEPHHLLQVYETLSTELEQLDNADESLEMLSADVEQLKAAYFNKAEKLTASRVKTAKKLNKSISNSMQTLGMSGGQFNIELSSASKASPSGMDIIEYKVSTNQGQPFKSLAKTASGGELARISLAIQMITAKQGRIPTLIFDEVDSGVGGGTAEIVGQHLRALGESRQVFCITHLPQVASQAHHHFQVCKVTEKKQTRTEIIPLEMEQRIDEISRMLGGVEITHQTVEHAREMLSRSQLNA